MSKTKLTVKKVERAKPGRYGDGNGLYLEVGENSASWLLRWERDGRERWHGLGSAADLTLDEAREEGRAKRKLVKAGIDPIDQKRAERAVAKVSKVKKVTFGAVAIEYFETHRPTWKHRSHIMQWCSSVLGHTLNGQPVEHDYCKPLRSMPVEMVDITLVLDVLKPIWHEKAETARRIRNRIEAVIDFATASKYRAGDNPASLKVIKNLLPKRAKVAKEHHAALDYRELPPFMVKLRAREGSDARALEFAILTGARSGEVMKARRSEINFEDKLWVVPAARMKGGVEHRQPLSQAALDLLRRLPHEGDEDGYLFIGSRSGQPLGSSVLQKLLGPKLGYTDVTIHGFRSTFHDWAEERTKFPRIVYEMALAHKVGTEVEQAYRRTELLEKRRRLIDQWAIYCASLVTVTDKKVVPIRPKKEEQRA